MRTEAVEIPGAILDAVTPSCSASGAAIAITAHVAATSELAWRAATWDDSALLAAAHFVLTSELGAHAGILGPVEVFVAALGGWGTTRISTELLSTAWTALGDAYPPEVLYGIHPDGVGSGFVVLQRTWAGRVFATAWWLENSVEYSVHVGASDEGRPEAIAHVTSPLVGCLVAPDHAVAPAEAQGPGVVGDGDVVEFEGSDALALLRDASDVMQGVMAGAWNGECEWKRDYGDDGGEHGVVRGGDDE